MRNGNPHQAGIRFDFMKKRHREGVTECKTQNKQCKMQNRRRLMQNAKPAAPRIPFCISHFALHFRTLLQILSPRLPVLYALGTVAGLGLPRASRGGSLAWRVSRCGLCFNKPR
jgi:hypothetical protein